MDKAKTLNTTTWALSVLIAAMFLLSGIPKFFDPGWISRFAKWGYSAEFLYLIAVLECLGAIGLLIPKLSFYAAIGLIIIMIGAMYTHLSHDESIVANLVYIALLAFIVIMRRKQRVF